MDAELYQAKERLRIIIEHQRGEIERRWLDRVKQDLGKHPGVGLTQLRDGMPDYLIELGNALRNPDTEPIEPQSLDYRAESAWSRVAREHGITRVRIGFDISQLVHEFVVLRRVISTIAREQDSTLVHTERLLAELMDAAISAAVQAYVDARDYEARREQASNIGFLTHELRHPLSAATLAATRLRRSASEDQIPALDMIDRAHARLSGLIDSVLLTEKLEADEVGDRPRPRSACATCWSPSITSVPPPSKRASRSRPDTTPISS